MSRPGFMPAGPGPAVAVAAALALSWLALPDVGFRDSGEIGTAAQGLGVAHPTGFAVDLLLLRAASLLPLGTVAFRQNLCVALEAALVLGLLAQLVDCAALALGVERPWARACGALLAAVGLSSWHTFAATALAVEVYTLGLLAALLALSGLARGGAAAGIALLVVGFAPGLHVTAGLFALLGLAGFCAHRGRAGLRFVAARWPLIAAGALIVSYLPLASLRQPALDWGDPEDASRILAHLTASRIRSAYQDEMLRSDTSASFEVVSQWLELWPLVPLALLGVVVGLRRKPLAVLAPLALCTIDLGYALWVNPMGAVDRQVGHMAGAALCLLAGAGAAFGLASARGRPGRALAAAVVLAAAVLLAARAPRSELSDGFAAGELLGSGGPLASLPPRAVLLCSNDDPCAVGLFALHAERVRPHLAVLPVQHLWDATVVRHLHGQPALRFELPGQHSPPEQRARAALAVLDELVNGTPERPLLVESAEALRGLRRRPRLALTSADEAPFARIVPDGANVAAEGGERALDRLDERRRARLAGGVPRTERARYQWSRAYGALGELALAARPRFAVRALRRAVELAPERSAAWNNLGAALEAAGELDAAVDATRRAIALDPSRPTAWVNLARFALRRDGPMAAREVLRLASVAGVRDGRLEQLARTLDGGAPPSQR